MLYLFDVLYIYIGMNSGNSINLSFVNTEVFGETLVHLPFWSAGITYLEYLYRHNQQSETEYIHTEKKTWIYVTGRV